MGLCAVPMLFDSDTSIVCFAALIVDEMWPLTVASIILVGVVATVAAVAIVVAVTAVLAVVNSTFHIHPVIHTK